MHIRSLTAGTALALLVSTVPALADLTAQQVWDDWKAVVELQGQKMTAGSERMRGDTLVISDILITMDQTDMSLEGTIEEVRLQERSDGSVSISMSPDFPISVNVSPQTGEQVEISMVMRQSGMTMVATGDNDRTRYDYLAPTIEFLVDDFTVNGETASDVDLDFNFNIQMNAVAGEYETSGDAPRQIDTDVKADSIAIQVHATEPGGTDGINLAATVEDLALRSTGTIASLGTFQALGELIEAGLETDGGYTYGAVNYTMVINDDQGSVNIQGGADSGGLDISLGPDGLEYGGVSRGIQFTVSGSQIPFPALTFALDESSGRIKMPIGASDEGQDFAMDMRLEGLSIDDMIWMIFDGGEVLPRDPATLILELTGKGNWFVDITDPEAVAEFEENPRAPGDIQALSLNRLLLTVAGAELNGTGDFTFDSSDLATFDGMPRPEGSATFNLIGANGLLDKLVQMGILPEDQAMGARMMMGIFARPGNGEDTLTSTIEVNSEGAVLANGQRLR